MTQYNFEEPEKRYKEEEPWLPLSNIMLNWDMKFHKLMLKDRIRMETYRKAIFDTITRLHATFKDKDTFRVMDIGTGTGVLAAWVAETWIDLCKKNKTTCRLVIYAIDFNVNLATEAEMNLKLFDNDYVKIKIIKKSSYELDINDLKLQADANLTTDAVIKLNNSLKPNCIDLIVSELLGNLGDNEDMVAILSHAKARFLKIKKGEMIPRKVEVYLVPISSQQLYYQVKNNKPEMLLTKYADFFDDKVWQKYCDAIIPQDKHLSDVSKECPVIQWDFSNEKTLLIEYKKSKEYEVTEEGQFHGFKSYFKAFLTDSVILDLSPNLPFNIPDASWNKKKYKRDYKNYAERNVSDCWKHGFLVADKPLDLKKGDKIKLNYQRIIIKDKPDFFQYIWSVSVVQNGKSVNTPDRIIEFNRPHVRSLNRIKLSDKILQLEIISREYPVRGKFLMDIEVVKRQTQRFFNPTVENMEIAHHHSADITKLLSDQRLRNKDIYIGFPLNEIDFSNSKYSFLNFKDRIRDAINIGDHDRIIYYKLTDSKKISLSRFLNNGCMRNIEFKNTILKYIKDDGTYFLTILVIPAYVYSKFSPEEISELVTSYLILEISIILEILNKQMIEHATRAAVAAIMGRNMAHNISSHVLSYWANYLDNYVESYKPQEKDRKTFKMLDVGMLNRIFSISPPKYTPTPTDLREYFTGQSWVLTDSLTLILYLKQRMDFIAEITTTMPSWEKSFSIADIIGDFQKQFAVLDNIARSEGFCYVYERNECGKAIEGRYRSNDCRDCPRLPENLKSNDEKQPEPLQIKFENEKKINVSIPHGLVGRHAFYSILENFIRNSAKHGGKILRTKIIEERKNNNNKNLRGTGKAEGKPHALIFNIKIGNAPQYPDYWEVNISDNVGNCNEIPDSKNNCVRVIDKLNDALEDNKYVRNDGQVERFNWGMKEIKISANFLRKNDIATLLYNQEPPLAILKCYDNCRKTNKCIGNQEQNLCMTIYLRKVKEVCIIVGNAEQEAIKLENVDQGINCYRLGEVKNKLISGGTISHRFILFYQIDTAELKKFVQNYRDQIPYRIVILSSEGSTKCLANWMQILKPVFINTLNTDDIKANPQSFISDLYKVYIESKYSKNINDGTKIVIRNSNSEIEDKWQSNGLTIKHSDRINSDAHIIFDAHGECIDEYFKHSIYYQKTSASTSFGIFIDNPPDGDKKELTIRELYESALTKVMIIDERIWKNSQRREETSDSRDNHHKSMYYVEYLKKMGIILIPVDDDRISETEEPKLINNTDYNGVHFLIIHRGIIEKMGLNLLDKIIESQKYPFILIDSGRGEPEKGVLKEGTRYIAISSIEQFLREGDKYSLVQTLYSIRRVKQ